jgi:hypothetical protein
MRICHLCKAQFKTARDLKFHTFDGHFLYNCRVCGERTFVTVRLHLSHTHVPGAGKIYRLGREFYLLRSSIVRCWKCFKGLNREQSEKMVIEKYSVLSGVEWGS